MSAMKKVINDPAMIVREVTLGLVEAYQGKVKQVEGKSILVKTEFPSNTVALLIGGGSGHEPLFGGFIGENLADGVVSGNIFAAPTPDLILMATKAVDQGKGVLYVYGNYAGDNMNFDIASELASAEGIETRTVRVWDDVAASPPDQIEERRGIAGDLFVIKIAGAVSAVSDNLEEVFRVAVKARDNTRSMGVALAPGTHPETGKAFFELGDNEIELGMGLHGEPGVSREELIKADELVEKLMARILEDLPFKPGDDVCLLVNDLGSTTMTELLIVNRKVRQILRDKDISVHDTAMGGYCTSQEMAGFSITLMKLDDELKEYYNMPADSLAYTKV